MLPHETQLQGQLDATCTAEGYTGDAVCTVCRNLVTPGQEIPMLPHETQLQGQLDATCTAPGYTGDMVCTCCQNLITPGEEIPVLMHTTRLENDIRSDCTEAGYSGDEVCTVCGQIVVQGHTLPLGDHRYEGGICLDCEGKDPNYIPPETAPGGIGDYEDTFAMSPIVIAGFAMLAVAFVGLLVLILLLLKKK